MKRIMIIGIYDVLTPEDIETFQWAGERGKLLIMLMPNGKETLERRNALVSSVKHVTMTGLLRTGAENRILSAYCPDVFLGDKTILPKEIINEWEQRGVEFINFI